MGACVSQPKAAEKSSFQDPRTRPNPESDTDTTYSHQRKHEQTNGTHTEPIVSPEVQLGSPKHPSRKSSQRSLKFTRSQKQEQQELRKSAEFWDREGLYSLPDEELVQHYHKDSELILKSLARLQQALHANPQSTTPSELTGSARVQRASVSLRGDTTPSAQDLLREANHSTTLSDTASICLEDGLVPGLPNQSLRVLLSSDPLITGARADFDDGRMLTARKKIRSWCKRHSLTMEELTVHSKQIGLDVAELEAHCAVIERAVENQRNEEGYRIARDDGELRVLYKTAHGGDHHCVKMEATLPFPLERPLSLAREFDLMKTWNKYMTESELLYAPSIWESFVYAGLWMPFPFSPMECLGKGRGYDLSEEYRCLMVACESVEEHELPKSSDPLPNTKKKHHRAEIIPGSSIRFEPLPPLPGDLARTKGTIVMIIDAHVPHVPAFIVNWVLGVMAPFAHKQIKKLLDTGYDEPSKPFPQRMAANHLLYDKVRKSVKEGLEKHYGTELTARTVQ